VVIYNICVRKSKCLQNEGLLLANPVREDVVILPVGQSTG
jgi:hypothetical protein